MKGSHMIDHSYGGTPGSPRARQCPAGNLVGTRAATAKQTLTLVLSLWEREKRDLTRTRFAKFRAYRKRAYTKSTAILETLFLRSLDLTSCSNRVGSTPYGRYNRNTIRPLSS